MSDLIGWWPLHDAIAQDLSDNANHGTINGGITTGVAGRGGLESMSFNGDGGYISTPGNNISISGQDPLSISVWFKWSGATDTLQGMFQSVNPDGTNSGNPPYGIKVSDTGTVSFNVQDSGNNYHDAISSAVTPNEWHHAVGVRDPNSGQLLVYIDGELEDTTPFTGDIYNVSNAPDIGVWKQGFNRYFTGELCDVRLYSRALSPSEVQTLYEFGSVDHANPANDGISYYPLDADIISTFEDGDANEFSSFTSRISASTATVRSGLYSAKHDTDGAGKYTCVSMSGLSSYPEQGDEWDTWFHTGGGGDVVVIGFGIQGDTFSSGNFMPDEGGYIVEIRDNQAFNLAVGQSDGSLSSYQIGTVPDLTSGWYRLNINWASDGTITATLYDSSGSQQVSGSHTDTKHTSGGIGLGHDNHNASATSIYFDDIIENNSIVPDSWGSNDGSNNDIIFSNDDIRNGSADLNGTSSYIGLNFASSIGTGPFTFSAWFRTNSTDNDIIVGNFDGNTGVIHRVNSSGFELWIDGTSYNFGTVVSDKWYHFVSVRDSSGNIRMYKNGKPIGTATDSSDVDSTHNFCIGRHSQSNSGAEFDGNIDDVRIYNRALDPWEVFELYRWGTRGHDMREKTVNK